MNIMTKEHIHNLLVKLKRYIYINIYDNIIEVIIEDLE